MLLTLFPSTFLKLNISVAIMVLFYFVNLSFHLKFYFSNIGEMFWTKKIYFGRKKIKLTHMEMVVHCDKPGSMIQQIKAIGTNRIIFFVFARYVYFIWPINNLFQQNVKFGQFLSVNNLALIFSRKRFVFRGSKFFIVLYRRYRNETTWF